MSEKWAFMLVLLLLSSAPILTNGSGGTNSTSFTVPAGYSLHEPISIIGNDVLNSTAVSEGFNGSGTESDPYVIEDLYIDANATSTALYLKNITIFLKIENCILTNSTWSNGLSMTNCKNIAIKNTIVENFQNGIYAEDCSDLLVDDVESKLNFNGALFTNNYNINITNSSFSFNSNDGISISLTTNLKIFNTDFFGNNRDSILFLTSTNIQLSELYASGNRMGFYLYNCENISFTKCEVINSTLYGTFLDDCNRIEITDSYYLDCNPGLNVHFSENISIFNSFFDGVYFPIDGLIIEYSKNIQVSNCNFSRSSYSIRTRDSHNITFTSLNLLDAQITLSKSSEVVLDQIEGNDLSTIVHLDECEKISISDVHGNVTFVGILIEECMDADIFDISLKSYDYGVVILDSINISIHRSEIESLRKGLFLQFENDQIDIENVFITSTFDSPIIIIEGNTNCFFSNLTLDTEFDSSIHIGFNTYDCTFENIEMFGSGLDLDPHDPYSTQVVYDGFKTCHFSNLSLEYRPVEVIIEKDLEGTSLATDPSQIILLDVSDLVLENLILVNRPFGILMVDSDGILIYDSDIDLEDYGILIFRSFNVSVEKTQLSNCGISVSDSDNISVTDSFFDTPSTGIYVYDSSSISIMDNQIKSEDIGLDIKYQSEVLSTGNIYYGLTSTGIYSIYSSLISDSDVFLNLNNGIEILDNKHLIVENGTFMACLETAISITNSYQFTGIYNSSITDCQNGISLTSGNDVNISNTEIKNCNSGIYASYYRNMNIEGSYILNNNRGMDLNTVSNSNIFGNLVYNNEGFGMHLNHCYDVTIWNNSFIDNAGVTSNYDPPNTQCYDSNTRDRWFHNFPVFGNHWSDLTSPDDDNNGIIDIHYIIKGAGEGDKAPFKFPTIELASSPLNFEVIETTSSVDLRWDPPAFSMDDAVLGYEIYRGTSEDSLSFLASLGSETPYFSDRLVSTGLRFYYQVRAYNSIGLGFPTEVKNGTADNTAPYAVIDSPEHMEIFSVSRVTLSWTITELESSISGIKYSIDGGNWIDLDNVNTVSLGPLSNGEHLFNLRVSNSVGLWKSTSVNFVTDTLSPELSFVEADPIFANNQRLTVMWNGEDFHSGISNYSYRVDNGEWLENRYKTKVELTLSDGMHLLDVIGYDNAGNFKRIHTSIIIDRTPPTLEITSPEDSSIHGIGNITVTLGMNDIHSGLGMLEVSIDDGEYVTIPITDRIVIPPQNEGLHWVFIVLTDRARNIAQASIEFIVDGTSPVIQSYTPDGLYVTLKPVIEVIFSEPIDENSLILDFDGIGDLNVTYNIVSFRVTDVLSPGTEYRVSISVSDIAGNVPAHKKWSFVTTNKGKVSGQIVDADGIPIPEVLISIGNNVMAHTGQSGEFLFETRMGDAILIIESEGMERRIRKVNVTADSEIDIGTIQMKVEEESRPIPIDLMMILGVGSIMLVILMIALFVVRKRRKDDFEFFIDPKKVEPGKRRVNNEDEFEDFWIDMGDDVLTDHYQVLGISRGANQIEIKKAYRKRASMYHPDLVHPLDLDERTEMEDMMTQVNEAKEVLMNPLRRTMYDAWLYDKEM